MATQKKGSVDRPSGALPPSKPTKQQNPKQQQQQQQRQPTTKKIYPRIIPPPAPAPSQVVAIVGSPRSGKARTRRNSLKAVAADSPSVQSSQTMLTATDSSYSYSNLSPGSAYEERPRVVLHMLQHMEQQHESGGGGSTLSCGALHHDPLLLL